MKYYLAFIYISDPERSEIKGFDTFQIPLTWEYDKNDDTWFALYAWSTNKKIMKKFKKERSDKLFRYKTVYSDELISTVDKKLIDLELKNREYKYQHDGESEYIISTLFEYNLSTDETNVIEVLCEKNIIPDPSFVNKSLLKIFEKFGYSYWFYSYSCQVGYDENNYNKYENELNDRYDVFWDTYSYKDIKNNTYRNEYGMVSNSLSLNEFIAFVNLFYKLFK